MSWKAVELQVAIPRTQETGKIQDQMSRQNQHFQESLTMNQLKQDELKRKRANELEEPDPSVIHDEDGGQNESKKEDLKDRRKQSQDEQATIKHPYLGSKIDLNG